MAKNKRCEYACGSRCFYYCKTDTPVRHGHYLSPKDQMHRLGKKCPVKGFKVCLCDKEPEQ